MNLLMNFTKKKFYIRTVMQHFYKLKTGYLVSTRLKFQSASDYINDHNKNTRGTKCNKLFEIRKEKRGSSRQTIINGNTYSIGIIIFF